MGQGLVAPTRWTMAKLVMAPTTRQLPASATPLPLDLQINDDAGEDMGDYFTSNARDLEVAFQTIDGFVSFPVETNIVNSNANRVTFSIPADLNALLSDIAVRDHYIFAITLPASRHAVEAGDKLNAFTASVSVQKRAAPRVEIQASTTLSAFTSTVSVNTRAVTRHVITVSDVFVRLTTTVDVQKRAVSRTEIQAAESLTAISATATVTKRAAPRDLIMAMRWYSLHLLQMQR